MNKRNNYFFNETSKKYLHREFYFSRYPKHNRSYDVHHIDGDKSNNNIDNLIAIPRELHINIHDMMDRGMVFNKKQIENLLSDFRFKSVSIEKLPSGKKLSKPTIGRAKPRKGII